MSDKTQGSAKPVDAVQGADEELVRSGRDAEATRRALVRAARRRFATDGYRATTVRQIAADVGVNVALINRYFVSKEGLFEACMERTSDELSDQESRPSRDVDQLIERLIGHAVNVPNGDDPLQLLLLLRSSGDDNADRIRRAMLERFSQKLAAVAGWDPDDETTEPLLLRAQIVIATMLGLVMLRVSAGAEPIGEAGVAELTEPLTQAFRSLLAGQNP